jgi:hypothetical protein
MSLTWLATSSLRSIDALLSEMERGVVDLDEETYRILRDIERERTDDLEYEASRSQPTQSQSQSAPVHGHVHVPVKSGTRGASWWRRHEQTFWFPRIVAWANIIRERLVQQQEGRDAQSQPEQEQKEERGHDIQDDNDVDLQDEDHEDDLIRGMPGDTTLGSLAREILEKRRAERRKFRVVL